MATKKEKGEKKGNKSARYWILAIQWCAQALRFYIHGMWHVDGSQKPTGKKEAVTFNENLKRRLTKYMPDLNNYGNKNKYPHFWKKVWRKHGCFSGMVPEAYFTRMIKLYKKLPSGYKELGLELDVKKSIGEVLNSIKGKISVTPQIKLGDPDSSEASDLHELYVYHNNKFKRVDSTKSLKVSEKTEIQLCGPDPDPDPREEGTSKKSRKRKKLKKKRN